MEKYAVPVSGGELCPHFGHCEQFAIIDVDETSKGIISKNIVPSPGHEPGFLPQWLAQQGVNKVIAGGMGSRAQGLFQQNNIEVIVGAMESDPEKAVLSYLNGELATGGNSCDH
ncbi:MAG: NifB/NifX family molybdenum-iron cluster-binding protein [Dehalococcoidales bacterium]|nr:NifB/NifX family molybdenum-iron cluster-binding protein [Dehalococcoidales bacterium]